MNIFLDKLNKIFSEKLRIPIIETDELASNKFNKLGFVFGQKCETIIFKCVWLIIIEFMDTRVSGSSNRLEQQNITNAVVYSLSKKLTLYQEMSDSYNKMAKMQLGHRMFTIYTYKPALYLGAATLFHLSTKRPSLGVVFIHFCAILFINQYDLNQGMKEVYPQKWE